MLQRIPPPPPLVGFPEFNRWLHDLTSFISTSGGIDPSQVPGFATLVAQVASNTADIANNTLNIALNTADIATNTANIATNTANIASNTTAITALQARAQVRNGNGVPGAGLGNNGDLYLNNTGAPGTRLYGKIGGAWVVIA